MFDNFSGMNNQGSYIIQGSLLALLISFFLFTLDKITSAQPIKENSGILMCGTPDINDVENDLDREGKTLFLQNCAACHNIFKDGTGPSLSGFEDRGPWRERQKLYEWIKNPIAFMKKNEYTRELKRKYGSVMTAFPDLSNKQIDAIVEYLK